MRVVLLADSFPPYISGVSTHVVELTRQFLKEGHDVLILTPKQKEKITPAGLEKAKIIRLPSFPSTYPGLRICYPNTPRVWFELKKFRAEVVDTQAPSTLGIDGLISAKFLKIPCVSTFHTLLASKEYLRMFFRIKNVGFLEKAGWVYHRWFYGSSDKIFVGTRGVRQLLISHGIKAEKIVIVPILFDLAKVTILNPQKKAQIKRKYRLKSKVAVFVGRLSSEKGLDTLVKIWAKIVKSFPDSTLLVIGEGNYKRRLEELVRVLGVGSNVAITGAIEHERLMTSGLLSAGDVFVSASVSETLGLTGLEAMAHGLPVVLFKSQGLGELVDGAGFVCERGDEEVFCKSIVKIFKDPKLGAAMGEKGRKIASKFDAEKGSKKIIEAYQAVVDNHKSRGNTNL